MSEREEWIQEAVTQLTAAAEERHRTLVNEVETMITKFRAHLADIQGKVRDAGTEAFLQKHEHFCESLRGSVRAVREEMTARRVLLDGLVEDVRRVKSTLESTVHALTLQAETLARRGEEQHRLGVEIEGLTLDLETQRTETRAEFHAAMTEIERAKGMAAGVVQLVDRVREELRSHGQTSVDRAGSDPADGGGPEPAPAPGEPGEPRADDGAE